MSFDENAARGLRRRIMAIEERLDSHRTALGEQALTISKVLDRITLIEAAGPTPAVELRARCERCERLRTAIEEAHRLLGSPPDYMDCLENGYPEKAGQVLGKAIQDDDN